MDHLDALLRLNPSLMPRMLPILAGIVVGSQAGPRRGMALAGAYVFSMALVYAALGVVAALLGANLQGWLMQPWLTLSYPSELTAQGAECTKRPRLVMRTA